MNEGVNNKIEKQLENIIIKNYGSINAFSKKIKTPNSTIVSILKRGIENAGVSNIKKICKELEIDIDILADKNEIVYKKYFNVKRDRYINFLPNNIYFLRKQRDMSDQMLADYFDYKKDAILDWEESKKDPNVYDLLELSKIFDLPIDDLIKKDLENEKNIISKKEVKEKVAQIVSNSELEENKKQMIINVVEVSCDE
jgi:transcriptional regulator with XRE-family HTH domain